MKKSLKKALSKIFLGVGLLGLTPHAFGETSGSKPYPRKVRTVQVPKGFYRKDGSINWSAIDAPGPLDKSVARRFKDTTISWRETERKEAVEDKAHAVVLQAMEVARFSSQLRQAEANLVEANESVYDALFLVRQLEREKAFKEKRISSDLLADVTGIKSPAVSLIERKIDHQIDKARKTMAKAVEQLSETQKKSNILNAKLQLLEQKINPEISCRLLDEAIPGIPVDALDAVLADEEGRAFLQYNLDQMHFKYLSKVPKVDLDTVEGRAYAKSFLLALSGQSQAHFLTETPPEMFAGNAALAKYDQKQKDQEKFEAIVQDVLDRIREDRETPPGFIGPLQKREGSGLEEQVSAEKAPLIQEVHRKKTVRNIRKNIKIKNIRNQSIDIDF